MHIEFDFKKGDMQVPILFIKEKINGVWESNADRDRYILENGHFEVDLNLQGEQLRIYFEKGTGSTDNGTLTTCYIDNLIITQNSLEIVEENNYYPFGLKHNGYNNVQLANHPYRYNGKELNEELELDWYDYGARNYDASLGRWMNIDELSEDYYNNSPYNYVANSPMIAYDPDGKRISIVGDKEYRSQVLMQLLLGAFNSETFANELNDAIMSENTLFIFNPLHEGDNLSVQEAGKNDESFGYDLSKSNESLDASNGRNGNELESNFITKLGHEIAHFNDPSKGVLMTENDKYSRGFSAEEVTAVETENQIRQEIGLDQRTHYKGVDIYGKGLKDSKNYPGNSLLTRKKDYALIAKENINNRKNRLSNINIILRVARGFYRGGTTKKSTFIKKPIPQQEIHLSPKN